MAACVGLKKSFDLLTRGKCNCIYRAGLTLRLALFILHSNKHCLSVILTSQPCGLEKEKKRQVFCLLVVSMTVSSYLSPLSGCYFCVVFFFMLIGKECHLLFLINCISCFQVAVRFLAIFQLPYLALTLYVLMERRKHLQSK